MKKILTILATITALTAIHGQAQADIFVNGYFKSNGTYVMPHYRSAPDGIIYNNRSYWD